MELTAIPILGDNYVWLLADGGKAWAVDPGVAAPVLDAVRSRNLTLAGILVTHHHADHVGGVPELRAATGAIVYGPAREPVPPPYQPLAGGETVDALGLLWRVIAVPGHTAGHLAYYAATLNKSPRVGAPGFGMGCEGERRGSKAACAALDGANGPGLWPGCALQGQSAAIPGGIASICNEADRPKPGCDSREGLVQRRLPPGDAPILFCGDTLFSAGCGRLFEGTPAQMLASLDRLAALPDPTRVCCAHEYTQGNLRFARAVEPDNAAIARHLAWCEARRAQGQATLPSTLALERQINPFLRTREPAVIAAARAHGADSTDAVAVLTALRAWKNVYA